MRMTEKGRGAAGAAGAAPVVTMRRATPADAPAVAGLLNAVIAEGGFSLLDTPFSVEDERAFIDGLGDRGLITLAEAGDDLVGFQTLEPWNAFVTHEFDHVATMGSWVAAGWRRRGIGRGLAAASFAAARELGFTTVFTDVRADNPGSLAFHLGLGFRVVGAGTRLANVRGRLVDVVFIQLDLDGV